MSHRIYMPGDMIGRSRLLMPIIGRYYTNRKDAWLVECSTCNAVRTMQSVRTLAKRCTPDQNQCSRCACAARRRPPFCIDCFTDDPSKFPVRVEERFGAVARYRICSKRCMRCARARHRRNAYAARINAANDVESLRQLAEAAREDVRTGGSMG